MITKTKGKKFDGDIKYLRDEKAKGCCETTKELLDMNLSEKEIDMIGDSFGAFGIDDRLDDRIQEIIEFVTDIGWNDEKYRPRSKGFFGKDMYPMYVMECLKKGVQDYDTIKKYGLI